MLAHMLDAEQLGLVLVAYAIAAVLKGLTGVGFSTVCLPLLAMAVDHRSAVALVIVPSIASNIFVMREAGPVWPSLTQFRLLYVMLLPGLACGMWLLVYIDAQIARGVLGGVLILYVWFALRHHTAQLPAHLGRWLQIPVGLVNGVLNALTGSQVMPLLPYMTAMPLDRDQFVQALNIAFTCSSAVLLIGFGGLGMVSQDVWTIMLIGLLPVVVGVWFGTRLRKRIDDALFKRCLLIIIGFAGVALVYRGLLAP